MGKVKIKATSDFISLVLASKVTEINREYELLEYHSPNQKPSLMGRWQTSSRQILLAQTEPQPLSQRTVTGCAGVQVLTS